MASECNATDNKEIENQLVSVEQCVTPSDLDKEEIKEIQTDINILIQNINDFIQSQKKTEKAITGYELTNDGNTSEKLDGPSEKSKMKAIVPVTPDAIGDSNSEAEIQEVDWSVAGPVLQQHVSDLQRLQILNKATSALIRRIRTLAVEKSLKKSMEPES